MLAAPQANHTLCSTRPCNRLAVSSKRCHIRRRFCCAAKHSSTAAGACDTGISTTLRQYGDHAKAAYVLFGQFRDNGKQPIHMEGNNLLETVERGSKDDPKDALGSLQGLEGYSVAANIMGYPGRAGVFTEPTPMKMGLAKSLEKPSFMGYVAQRTGRDGVPELVIAFRGSEFYADWETNLLGAVAADGLYDSGRVHTGFYNLIRGTPHDAEDDVNPAKIIQAVLAPYKDVSPGQLPRIITTGHSLGGALAILAGVFIALEIPGYRQDSADYTSRMLQTYTFAAPRIGDGELSEYIRKKLKYTAVQVKNKPDAVPYAPPAGLREMFSIVVPKAYGMLDFAPPQFGEMVLLAAPARDTELEQWSSPDVKRWQTYKNLQSELQSTDPDEQVKELQQYVDQLDQAGERRSKITAEKKGLKDRVKYIRQLLTTLATKWADNPAPDSGTCVLDVCRSGRWGGQNHSLEVYLDNLDSCNLL